MKRYYIRRVIDPYQDYQYELYNHISNTDQKFLSVATKLAFTSDNRFRVGAIVVKSGRVLGGSSNITRKSPSTPPNRFSTHAEVAAIKVASETHGSTLYVSRVNSINLNALARPCSWCIQKIMESGIDKVVYTSSIDSAESFYISSVKWSRYV